MRIVLDTNVLISACWKPGGLEARVVNLARAGAITLCISAEVGAEYRDVLGRDKFKSIRDQAAEMLENIESMARLVVPQGSIAAAGDEDDNRFLECAESSQATYLITGNLRHYPSLWGTTRVVNTRLFLEIEFPSQLP